jgi:predicted HTH domain antitoxin
MSAKNNIKKLIDLPKNTVETIAIEAIKKGVSFKKYAEYILIEHADKLDKRNNSR